MPNQVASFFYNEQHATRRLNVAGVAMACDRDPSVNRVRIAETVGAVMQAHPNTQLVVFGEMTLGWYRPGASPDYDRRISQSVSRKALEPFAALALQHGIYLSLGLSEIDGPSLYNAQVLLNPRGQLQAVHRKRNLKVWEREAGYLPGSLPVTITDIEGVRTGIVICADAASPRTMWALIRSRLDLVILSLADDRDEDRFAAQFSARMVDAWIVTANRYGREVSEDGAGWTWNGHLVISDPCGRLRVTGQDREQFLAYELRFADDQCRLKRMLRQVWVKAPLPFYLLRHRRKIKAYL